MNTTPKKSAIYVVVLGGVADARTGIVLSRHGSWVRAQQRAAKERRSRPLGSPARDNIFVDDAQVFEASRSGGTSTVQALSGQLRQSVRV
jgi:hypothetical protein